MKKPKHITTGYTRTSIHLHGTIPPRPDNPVGKFAGEFACPVAASAVHDNDFRFRCSLANMLEKWADQRRFVPHRHDDGNTRSLTTGHAIPSFRANSSGYACIHIVKRMDARSDHLKHYLTAIALGCNYGGGKRKHGAGETSNVIKLLK